MKKNILFLGILIAGLFLASCEGGKDKVNDETAMVDSILNIKPDWSNKKKLKQLLNDHYYEATLKQGRMAGTITNPDTGAPIYYIITSMSEDSLFQHTENSLSWTTVAKVENGKDSLLVDYKFSWQKPMTMTDTTKADFFITGTSLRRYKDKEFYKFVKRGNLWEKVAVRKETTI